MSIGIRKFTRSSLVAFGIKIGSAGLAFLMFVALSRAMDPTAYGVFGTLFSLATLCAVVGSFGQRNNVMRFASGYDEVGKDALRRGAIQFGYLLTTTGAVIAGLCGAIVLLFLLADVADFWTMSGLLVLTIGIGLTEYQTRAMRVSGSVMLSLLPRDIVWRALIVVSAAAVALLYGRVANTGAFWTWYLGLTLLATCLIQWLIYEHKKPNQSFRGETEHDRPAWLREMRGPWASLVITSAGANLSVLLVGILIDIEQAGPFFSALRVAQLLNVFMLAIEVVLVPMIARNATTENWKQVQKLSTWTAVLGGGFGLLGTFVLAIAGEPLLVLFGPEVSIAYPALLVLAVGFLINTLAGPTAPLMAMTGHASELAKFQFYGTAVGLALMPLAVYWFGLIGAAGCITAIKVFWNARAWHFARYTLAVDPTIISLISKPQRP